MVSGKHGLAKGPRGLRPTGRCERVAAVETAARTRLGPALRQRPLVDEGPKSVRKSAWVEEDFT